MFSRLQFLTGTDAIGTAALILCALVFIAYIIYAFRMSKEQIDHMAELPLQDDTAEPNNLK